MTWDSFSCSPNSPGCPRSGDDVTPTRRPASSLQGRLGTRTERESPASVAGLLTDQVFPPRTIFHHSANKYNANGYFSSRAHDVVAVMVLLRIQSRFKASHLRSISIRFVVPAGIRVPSVLFPLRRFARRMLQRGVLCWLVLSLSRETRIAHRLLSSSNIFAPYARAPLSGGLTCNGTFKWSI